MNGWINEWKKPIMDGINKTDIKCLMIIILLNILFVQWDYIINKILIKVFNDKLILGFFLAHECYKL